MQIPSKNIVLYLIAIPLLSMLYLMLSHFISTNYLYDRFLPIIITMGLFLFLSHQHQKYWDKSIIKSEYISKSSIFISMTYLIILIIILVKISLEDWFSSFVPRGALFYYLPFIISAYVAPFLLFSHVLADSNDSLKRLKYTASAYLFIILCIAFWYIRQIIATPH